jgi:ketosteroid isomerase-like protein
VAIVHYYYSAAYKNTDGKEKVKKGRNTDILLKQKDKWVLIGDHVGRLGNKREGAII